MKIYIGIQVFLITTTQANNGINLETVTRKITAETENEALGKFVKFLDNLCGGKPFSTPAVIELESLDCIK